MLKTSDIKLKNSKHAATNILVKLEDDEVHPEQYTFYLNQIKKYKFYINNEYSFKSKMEYEKSSHQLSIEINIIIPENSIPEDPKKAKETIMDPIKTFHTFYEVETVIYKRNHQKISIS